MENWKSVKGFDDYEVSDLGNIRRKATTEKRPNKTGINLTMSRDNGRGYVQVPLSRDGKRFNRLVHRIVYDSFVGLSGVDYMSVNHRNGCKTDNRLCNLEEVPHRKNVSLALSTGRDLPVGVYRMRKKFSSSAKVKSKNYNLGIYTDPLIAGKAYEYFVSLIQSGTDPSEAAILTKSKSY